MFNNDLIYTGSVDIKIGKQRQLHRNTGTKELFRLFCLLLSRTAEVTTTQLPAYIMIYAAPKTQVVSTSAGSLDRALYHPVSIDANIEPNTAVTHSVEEDVCLKFSCRIDPQNVSHNATISSSGSAMNYTLALLDGTQQHILAAVSMRDNELDLIKQGNQAQITWTMSIGNKE